MIDSATVWRIYRIGLRVCAAVFGLVWPLGFVSYCGPICPVEQTSILSLAHAGRVLPWGIGLLAFAFVPPRILANWLLLPVSIAALCIPFHSTAGMIWRPSHLIFWDVLGFSVTLVCALCIIELFRFRIDSDRRLSKQAQARAHHSAQAD